MSNTPETDAFAANMSEAFIDPAWCEFSQQLERERDEWSAMCGQYKQERDEARELTQQMSESNQVLMADARFYRKAWELGNNARRLQDEN